MSQLCKILCLLFLTASCAVGEFAHPFVSPGEVYTNTMMLDLFYAKWERQEAVNDQTAGNTNAGRFVYWPPQDFAPQFAQTYEMLAGSNSTENIVTNGSIVVTNVLWTPVYSNVVLTNEQCFLPYVYAGFTNMPHVTRRMLLGTSSEGLNVYYGLDNHQYDISDELYPMTELYVEHWQASNGTFNSWFSDGRTELPLMWDVGAAMSYTNVGIVENIITNDYGQIIDSSWAFTRTPPVTQNWNLAETVYTVTNTLGTNTAVWLFREQTPMDNVHIYSNTPSVVFTPGTTNAFLPVDLVVSGLVWFGEYDPGRTDPTGPPPTNTRLTEPTDVRNTSNTTESITISSTNAVSLTKPWKRITSIIVTNVVNTGDTYSVVYDGLYPLHGEMAWTLTAQDHNERRSVLDCLRWSYDIGAVNDQIAASQSNILTWTGTSTSSWNDAKNNAAAATPTYATGTPGQRWTRGSYDGTTWTATAKAGRTKFYVLGPGRADIVHETPWMSPNYEHQIDLYLMYGDAAQSTNGTHVFDAFEDEAIILTNDIFYAFTNVYTGYATNQTVGTPYADDGWIGSTNFPDTWCSTPGTNNPTSRGFIANNALTVIKWDATTNGFIYIRE